MADGIDDGVDGDEAQDGAILPLEGWMTLPDAARLLGITRSRIHQLVPAPGQAGQLKSARKIGRLTIVRTVEVEERLRRLKEAAGRKAERGKEAGE